MCMPDYDDILEVLAPKMIASGPYLHGDGNVAYLRVTFDQISNSGTVTLMLWVGEDGLYPDSSLVWCPNSLVAVENTSDDDGPKNPREFSVPSWLDEESGVDFGNKREYGILGKMFASARNSETLKSLSNLTDKRRMELISEDEEGLGDELARIGNQNPYPINGTNYIFNLLNKTWETSEVYQARFDKWREPGI